MTRALTLITNNRIDAQSVSNPAETTAPDIAEDVFAAFHNDLHARSKIAAFTCSPKRRGL